MRFVRCKTTSGYEAMILTPKQAFDVLMHLQEPERAYVAGFCHRASHLGMLGLAMA
jgi:hypothetical protein